MLTADRAATTHVAIAGTRRQRALAHRFLPAQLAAQPVGLADYPRREIGIEHWLMMSGDTAADLARIAACYKDRQGLNPSQTTPIRFRDPT
ncbi:MAG: hypothetical protein R3E65_12660 [Steroidobacteraceae bacterium]